MQHRSSLYVETSVFGFHFDRRETNRSKREATQQLFAQIRNRIFEGFTGAATVLELERTEDEQLRAPYSTCSRTPASGFSSWIPTFNVT